MNGPAYQWATFLPDKAVKKIKEPHKAGMFSFRGHIHGPVSDDNPEIDFKEYKVWKKAPPRRIFARKIRAYIYQCRDLPASDANGTSDPYIEIWDKDVQTKKTRIIEDTLNPIYCQTLELNYEVESFKNKDTWPPIIFDCYDYDSKLVGDARDFMGRAIVQATDCAMVD